MLSVPDRLAYSRTLGLAAPVLNAVTYALGLAFAIPVFRGIRQGAASPSERMTLFILGMVAIQFVFWPFYLGARSGMSVLPFLTTWLWRGIPGGRARTGLLVLLLFNVAANVWFSRKLIRSQEQESIASLSGLASAARWITQNGAPESSVAAGRDVPLSHLYEYLGRRVLANSHPEKENRYVDVTPEAQGNRLADYAIIDPAFDRKWWMQSQGRYKIVQTYGRWIIASPRRHEDWIDSRQ